VQVLELGRLLALVGLEQVDRLLAHHAGDGPVLRVQLDALADEVDRVPPADAAEPQEALVVDVADHQPDLVDVADDRQARRARRGPGHAGRRRAHDVGAHVVAERPRGVLPHGGGRALAPGRAGRGQQVAQSSDPTRPRHGAQTSASRSWRSTYGRIPPWRK
jgi:hypothetical protein